jgi:hypothetical protein
LIRARKTLILGATSPGATVRPAEQNGSTRRGRRNRHLRAGLNTEKSNAVITVMVNQYKCAELMVVWDDDREVIEIG